MAYLRVLAAGSAFLVVCSILPAFQSGDGNGKTASEFFHDFRRGPIPPELTWFNAEEGKFFKQEAAGLRITIPKTWIHPWGGVGFRTSFGLAGDFEVTTTVEILQAETPPSGFGVGVNLYVAKGGGGAALCRLVRPNDRQIVLWNQAIEVPGQKGRNWPEGRVPCTDKLLRLRLKRTGPTLSYQWAPGTTGDSFQEIHQDLFGPEDIDRVRLTAMTGQKPCNLDVRLIDLRIRSQTSDMPAAASPEAEPRGWLVILLACLLVLTLAVGVGLGARQRHRRGKPPAPAKAASPLSFACSACGKNLMANAELAGKKVKCRHCGQGMLVPATSGT